MRGEREGVGVISDLRLALCCLGASIMSFAWVISCTDASFSFMFTRTFVHVESTGLCCDCSDRAFLIGVRPRWVRDCPVFSVLSTLGFVTVQGLIK